ncbi:MAG: iron uptake transporter permease EfeU [Mycobacteriales bacterium]
MPGTLVPNFLIGLREGLEAALVVSILVAFLVKTQRRSGLKWVWTGVAAAVAFSIVSWFTITYVLTNIDSFRQQELTGGILSLVAVAFVTWMIFWMRRTGRQLGRELSEKLSAAVALGPIAIVVVAFLAVAREGLETSIFLWSASQAAEEQLYPLLGALAGIAISIVLAYLIYISAIKLNLRTFFTVTGVGLILVAAGIAGYGIHDLQEARYLPGLNNLAWDISGSYDETTWYGSLLVGMFNINAQTTVLQAVVYFGYLAVVLALFLTPQRPRAGTVAPPGTEQLAHPHSTKALTAAPLTATKLE